MNLNQKYDATFSAELKTGFGQEVGSQEMKNFDWNLAFCPLNKPSCGRWPGRVQIIRAGDQRVFIIEISHIYMRNITFYCNLQSGHFPPSHFLSPTLVASPSSQTLFILTRLPVTNYLFTCEKQLTRPCLKKNLFPRGGGGCSNRHERYSSRWAHQSATLCGQKICQTGGVCSTRSPTSTESSIYILLISPPLRSISLPIYVSRHDFAQTF